MDIIFSDGVKCVKGVIYENLIEKFDTQLVEGESYSITKAKLKNFKGPAHHLPLTDFQLEFQNNTEIYQLENKKIDSPHYPLPITTLQKARELKPNTIIDIDCIIQNASNEAAKYPSGTCKKEIFVYDNSSLPGKTMTFDIWNDDITRFQDLNSDLIYRLQVKDAKVTNYGNQTTLGLSFTGKITLSPVTRNSPEYQTVCKWHNKQQLAKSSTPEKTTSDDGNNGK